VKDIVKTLYYFNMFKNSHYIKFGTRQSNKILQNYKKEVETNDSVRQFYNSNTVTVL
jgi:hypothetical protein